jgi:hypothetical protein
MPWELTGNAGTDPQNDFLGTTDGQPLVIRTNGREAVRVDTAGSVGIGTVGPNLGARLDLFANDRDVLHAFTAGDVAAAEFISEDPQTLQSTVRAFAGGRGAALDGTSSSGRGPGVRGASSSEPGVVGVNTRGGCGVNGNSDTGTGVAGISGQGTGVVGLSSGTGVVGIGGVEAGRFMGDVTITGTLSKAAGGFRIDHPLDPANRYLCHSFVESPDMKNMYDGVTTLDANGQAEVQLPGWFEALNEDLRYQLTSVGVPAPRLHISREVFEGRFEIAGGEPGMKVCWQVTGTRCDPYAQASRIMVEEDKPRGERGHYLHPALHGEAEERSIEWARDPKAMRLLTAQREMLPSPTGDTKP